MTDSDPAQRAYRFLQALASDLSNKQISFPTFTGATIRVRSALADPAIDAERLAHVISAEPLLPARLIQIANSVAMNPGGKPISDVRNAVMRVGHDVVRSTAVALAMEQLRAAKDVQVFHEQAEWVWRHSLEVAAISYVMAKKESRLNPDEALFAGLVHDIGRFYLLSRASAYAELVQHPQELDALIHEWHGSIGQAVLHEFHVSEATLRAVSEHEDHHPSVPPRQLVDVVTLANRVALQSNPPRYPAHVERDVPGIDNPALMQSLAASADDIRALLTALRG
ncbi:MAG TPA: HDOD domain-containing protein [Casimicrobiaceae bacterium]|jgi:putative nucleotidyltransferase with HDIG domain|nr:HDOD domain-containing protein [Casimicrobiaceae bacterium]